ncbi:tyrosine-protein kinase EpsD [Piscinibacter sakaiensis]|uniref:non-specific protein-tyrosine kinase n=2 Tax=Piscinibacter sakaiensis TaxID=1547922 RepID=A0A0K8NZ21_PISS1|nr:tyrosine-protein kinase EpsD [Piscinibacter sakaiensis]
MNMQATPGAVIQAASPAPPPFLSLKDALSDEQRLELVEYWRSITKRKWVILLLGIAVAIAAGAVAFSLPAVFRSTATVLIEPDKNKVVKIDEVYGGIGTGREYFQTQVEIIKSRDVALKTIEGLKLWEVPEFDPRKDKDDWKAKLKQAIGLTEPEVEWTDEKLARETLGKFNEALDVAPVRLSNLVKVSFESQDPALAARVVSTVAEIYVNNDRESRFKLTQQANQWLQDRVVALRQKLDASERALQAYREGQGLVNLGGSAQAIDSQQIANITQQLVQARVRRAENEGVYKEVLAIRNAKRDDYSSVAAVMRHPAVVEAKKQEAIAQQKVSELSQRYGFEHPRMVAATAELNAASQSVATQADAVATSLMRDYEISRATERQLEGELANSRGSVVAVNRKEAQLGVLERAAQADRQLYELFIGRAKETSASNDLQTQVARVVDPPVLGGKVRPKEMQIIAVAFALGLFGGVLLSLLLDKLDNTLKGQEDAESRLKQPLLTSLPILKGSDRKQVMRLAADRPDSMFAEGIRTARTSVMLSSIDSPKKIILVTSSVPGEGKTVVSTNLALAHATTRRTLLIDADMRRPAVARGLALPPGLKGLSDLTSGDATLDDCIHVLEDSHLHVISSGATPPNPTELLLSQRFKDTLRTLQERYDIILIDSPPVELVSDALVLAPLVTGTIYVVKAMDTPYQLARKGLVRLQRSHGTLLGVVLNYVDFKKAQKYYGQYSAYGQYGYGGYGYKLK